MGCYGDYLTKSYYNHRHKTTRMSSKSYLQRFQMVSLKANQCIKKFHHKRQRLLLRIYQPNAFMTRRASLHTSTTREKATITLSPSPALFDQETRVVIEGLLVKQTVTVAATFENDAGRFMSHAFYEADNQGTVDLSTSPALGGRYTGVEPMGFLWSMTGSDESRPGLFYFNKNLPVPDDVHLYVLSGHTQATSMKHIETAQVLCETPHQRTFMVEGVKRSLVREGRIRGSLFLPPGDGPFPGVINIYGLTPGLHDIRAALLANKGFATLGLAYFGYDDLSLISTTMEQEVDMEYFEEAVEWFSSHPLVSPAGIGVMGYSKSCDLVMYMAIMSSRVKATVAINGFNFYTSFKHYKDGHLLPSFRDHVNYAVDTPEGITFVDSLPATPISEDCLIPVEKAPWTQYLFINGADDTAISPVFTDRMIQRLKDNGLSNYRLLRYPGCGHMLEVPYTPVARCVYSGWYRKMRVMGGNPRDINRAQIQSWNEIESFFREQLC